MFTSLALHSLPTIFVDSPYLRIEIAFNVTLTRVERIPPRTCNLKYTSAECPKIYITKIFMFTAYMCVCINIYLIIFHMFEYFSLIVSINDGINDNTNSVFCNCDKLHRDTTLGGNLKIVSISLTLNSGVKAG